MTAPPDPQPAEPHKKDYLHHLNALALVGCILLIALVFLFIALVSSGQNTGSAAGGVSPGNGPVASEMPVAEITTKMVTCQVTGVLSLTGMVKSNVNRQLFVQIEGNAYDAEGDQLGTGSDTVALDPEGTSSYHIRIIDGCQLGETGTYDVRITNINWRHTD